MATFRYFSDMNGETVELTQPHGMPKKDVERLFPGVKARWYDSFTRWVGYHVLPCGTKTLMPVTRAIERKRNPSMHVCDARCMNAKGHSCECSCNGKNHGAGGFRATAT